MDVTQLQDLKINLKDLIANNKVGEAIDLLRQTIPTSLNRYNLLIKFQQEQAAISELRWKNIQSEEILTLRNAKLVDNLLEFVDSLGPEDFLSYPPSPSNTKQKTGSVLYAIPPKMEVNKEKKCIVRLAFDEALLAEFCNTDSSTRIESLRRIEEQMEVEIIDPNEEAVFAIRTINSKMQIVEKDDFTEWIYYVKPLKEGIFELYLKVTVIIPEKGKKEIVLHEKIEVTTHAPEEAKAEVMAFKHAGLIFTLATPTGSAAGGEESGATSGAEVLATTGSTILGLTIAKFAAIIAGIGLAGALYFFWPPSSGTSEMEANNEGIYEVIHQIIQPPLTELNPVPEVFIIHPEKDTSLQLRSGSSLHYAGKSLVDEQNNMLTDSVEISIREFRTAPEIIAGGIPMRFYDAAGKEHWMQTAGMFEVIGRAQGKKVSLGEGKTLRVTFATQVSQDCDFWQFEEARGNWANTGKQIKAVDFPEEPSFEQKEVNPLPERKKPSIQPVLGNPEKILPPFKINYKYFPELKQFRDLEWEYAGKDPAENPRNNPTFYDPWNSIIIEKGSGSQYQLSFTRPKDTLVVPVRPCFRREQDLQDFNRNFANLERQTEALREQQRQRKDREVFRQQQFDFIREVEISQFGLYNWDYLIKLDDAIPLLADFDFDGQLADHLKEEVIVYLITGNNQAVVAFPKANWSRFSFIPTMNNKLLALLPDGRVALFSNKDFETDLDNIRQSKNGNYRFNLKVQPEKIKDLQDLEKILI